MCRENVIANCVLYHMNNAHHVNNLILANKIKFPFIRKRSTNDNGHYFQLCNNMKATWAFPISNCEMVHNHIAHITTYNMRIPNILFH